MEINKEELYGVVYRKPWYKYITIEPTMFFYMMAFMITSVIEQTFYVFRACTVNHGYSEDICYDINKHVEINHEVQVTMSTFHQWNGIASHVVPLLLAFFLGSYSDKRGRKSILLAGLLGKLYFSFMITIITTKAWPIEYVIYAATFPSAMTGADLAIFAACFAYIADVSSVKNRTLRVGILDVVYLSTMPTGVAIDERPVMYLYTTIVFKWDATDFSHFRTYLSTAYVIVMLFGIPLMTKLFKMRDTVIVMVGASAHIAGHAMYARATDSRLMFAGASAAALGPCVAPLLRSMTSKVLPANERGVAYAFLSVMENAVAMFASIVYSQLYKATLQTDYITSIFYLTMSTQVIVFILSFTMELLLKGQRLESLSQEERQITEADQTVNLPCARPARA